MKYQTIETNLPLNNINLPKLIVKYKNINFNENKQNSLFNNKNGQIFSSN
jgi:hypothetical protein